MVNNLRSIAVWLVKGSFFIIPFIPLYISRSLFFPYITGKNFIFRVIVEIAFAAWVFLAIYFKEYRPRKSPLTIAVLVFIGVVALATIFSLNPSRSFWSNFERMEGLVGYLHIVALFFIAAHVFNKKDWFIFLNLFVVAGIYENIYALVQKLGYLPSPQGGFRVDGTIGNSAYLAAYLVFLGGMAALLYVQSQSKLAKYYYAAMGVFSLISIYFTATRGAIVAAYLGVAVFCLLHLFLKKGEPLRSSHKKFLATALVVLAAIPVLFLALRNSSFILDNSTLNRVTPSALKRAAETRFTIWGMGWNGFKERPILGWGLENYAYVFSKYYEPSLYAQEAWFDRSHNVVFDWLISAGILGLLSFLFLFIAAFWMLYRLRLGDRLSLDASLVLGVLFAVYFIQDLFVFDNFSTYIAFFSLLAFIHSVWISDEKEKAAKEFSPWLPPTSASFVAPVLLLPAALLVYLWVVNPLRANLYLLSALRDQNVNRKFEDAFANYEKALSFSELGRQEVAEQLGRFATLAADQDLDEKFKVRVFNRAIGELKRVVENNPLEPRDHLFLGTVYAKVQLYDEAFKHFDKARELSPRKQQVYFEIADIYIKREDYAKALEVLKMAYDADSRFDMARLNYAAVLILNGNQEEADRLIVEKFGIPDIGDMLLAQVYARTKKLDRLFKVQEALIKSDPLNSEHAVNIAKTFVTLKRPADAINALREAISRIPEFKQQGEYFISEIRAGRNP